MLLDDINKKSNNINNNQIEEKRYDAYLKYYKKIKKKNNSLIFMYIKDNFFENKLLEDKINDNVNFKNINKNINNNDKINKLLDLDKMDPKNTNITNKSNNGIHKKMKK